MCQLTMKTPKKTTRKKAQKKAGRPSSYHKTHGSKLEAVADGNKGWTDKEIAELFGVSEQTINTWKKKYPEFLESIKRAKVLGDDAVERSLFQRATGYSVPEVHISVHQGDVEITPIIKHYAPDVLAQIFWLKNRRPKLWRDKQEIDHGVTDAMGELMRELDGTAYNPGNGQPTEREST